MTTKQIMSEMNKVEALAETEAMYYLPQTDEVVVGRNGCQPGNSLCLRAGADHIDNLNIADIEDSINEFLAR